jgi:hypothetical protein
MMGLNLEIGAQGGVNKSSVIPISVATPSQFKKRIGYVFINLRFILTLQKVEFNII